MQQAPQYNPLMQSIIALSALDKRRRAYRRVGWIHAARNSCFVDPVLMIGQSKVSPVVRVGQLSSSTSVYRPFELVYWVHVSDRDRAQGYAHQLLQQYRMNPGRELFAAPVMEVARALDQAAEYFPIPLGRTPRSGYLKPGLAQNVVRCSRCGTSNRAPRLLVSIRISCGNCPEQLTSQRHRVLAEPADRSGRLPQCLRLNCGERVGRPARTLGTRKTRR